MGQFLQSLLSFARRGVMDTLDISSPSILNVSKFINSTEMVGNAIRAMALKWF